MKLLIYFALLFFVAAGTATEAHLNAFTGPRLLIRGSPATSKNVAAGKTDRRPSGAQKAQKATSSPTSSKIPVARPSLKPPERRNPNSRRKPQFKRTSPPLQRASVEPQAIASEPSVADSPNRRNLNSRRKPQPKGSPPPPASSPSSDSKPVSETRDPTFEIPKRKRPSRATTKTKRPKNSSKDGAGRSESRPAATAAARKKGSAFSPAATGRRSTLQRVKDVPPPSRPRTLGVSVPIQLETPGQQRIRPMPLHNSLNPQRQQQKPTTSAEKLGHHYRRADDLFPSQNIPPKTYPTMLIPRPQHQSRNLPHKPLFNALRTSIPQAQPSRMIPTPGTSATAPKKAGASRGLGLMTWGPMQTKSESHRLGSSSNQSPLSSRLASTKEMREAQQLLQPLVNKLDRAKGRSTPGYGDILTSYPNQRVQLPPVRQETQSH